MASVMTPVLFLLLSAAFGARLHKEIDSMLFAADDVDMIAAADRILAGECPSQAVVTPDVLARQDATTSAWIICAFKDNPLFAPVASKLTVQIMQRDEEDGQKLQEGIQMAIEKGVLDDDITVPPVHDIFVEGKTADEVADEIVESLGDAPTKGCVMTLQGLSGTGKGTTLALLKKKLPNAHTWSNGNIFRSLTLLAVTYAEQNQCALEDALAPDKLASFVDMLEFGNFNGIFDVKIDGLGLNYYVSRIAKTVLKERRVAKQVPTVAHVTQGEVVNFVNVALEVMTASRANVLIEGREQTLNHIPTPYKFGLVFHDLKVIGTRRAAQIMGGQANEMLKKEPGEIHTTHVMDALEGALRALHQSD